MRGLFGCCDDDDEHVRKYYLTSAVTQCSSFQFNKLKSHITVQNLKFTRAILYLVIFNKDVVITRPCENGKPLLTFGGSDSSLHVAVAL